MVLDLVVLFLKISFFKYLMELNYTGDGDGEYGDKIEVDPLAEEEDLNEIEIVILASTKFVIFLFF
jgi:hypothetical protein